MPKPTGSTVNSSTVVKPLSELTGLVADGVELGADFEGSQLNAGTLHRRHLRVERLGEPLGVYIRKDGCTSASAVGQIDWSCAILTPCCAGVTAPWPSLRTTRP